MFKLILSENLYAVGLKICGTKSALMSSILIYCIVIQLLTHLKNVICAGNTLPLPFPIQLPSMFDAACWVHSAPLQHASLLLLNSVIITEFKTESTK